MEIRKLEQDFTVCKVQDYSQVKLDAEFCFIEKTAEEHSLVCLTSDVPENVTEREDGWKAFYIQGVLDFSWIGILAQISVLMAENRIGIFVVSTYQTDYIFTKKEDFFPALKLLSDRGYDIIV